MPTSPTPSQEEGVDTTKSSPPQEDADPSQTEISPTPPPIDRAARFAALKARATAAARSNLAEAKAEASRSAVDQNLLTSLARKSAVASHNLLKADTEASGGSGAFERKRAW